MSLLLYSPHLSKERLAILEQQFHDYEPVPIPSAHTLDLRGKKLLLAQSLDASGADPAVNAFLSEISARQNPLEDSTVGCFVESQSDFFTRIAGVNAIYLMNRAGATLPGRSLVEATPGLSNFEPLQKVLNKTPEELFLDQLDALREGLSAKSIRYDTPRLSVWTIGRPGVSATRAVWELIEPHLSGLEIDFLNFGNQNIRDCRGCAYEICKEMGAQTRCIYEDYIVETLYPSIEKADAVLIMAPNYNDMLPANFVSAINRLTALFRKRKFYDKQLFSVIVAGYTGAELLSRQLISALHINKTFALPPRFSLELRAQNVESVQKNEALPQIAQDFALHIQNILFN